MALLAAGCTVDLAIEVTDDAGNHTVVPLNAEPVALAEAADDDGTVTRGSDAAPLPAPTTSGAPAADGGAAPADDPVDADPTPTPAQAAAEDSNASPEAATPTAVTATPSPDPVPADEPPADDDAEVTATPLPTGPPPTDDPTPTPTATPPPTPTPAPIEFVIAPDAPLLGVALGTDAGTAMAALEATIGEPDFDSGWYVGCPLDGDDEDERLVQWGDLNVYFDRSDGTEAMQAWGYDLRIVDGGFPELDLIELPGGARMGDPVNEVAAAAGLQVRFDELFEINRVGESGYEILADAPPGAPVWGAFVPGIPTCE